MKRFNRSDSNKRGTRFGHVGANILGASLLLGTLLLGLSMTVPVAHVGNPAPPPNPPVYYNVHVLGLGAGLDMNEYGIIVGYSPGGGVQGVATMYSLGGGGAVNLNTGATLIDLDATISAVPRAIESTDWIAVQANGINLFGEIVGIAQNSIGTTSAFHNDRSWPTLDSKIARPRMLPSSRPS